MLFSFFFFYYFFIEFLLKQKFSLFNISNINKRITALLVLYTLTTLFLYFITLILFNNINISAHLKMLSIGYFIYSFVKNLNLELIKIKEENNFSNLLMPVCSFFVFLNLEYRNNIMFIVLSFFGFLIALLLSNKLTEKHKHKFNLIITIIIPVLGFYFLNSYKYEVNS